MHNTTYPLKSDLTTTWVVSIPPQSSSHGVEETMSPLATKRRCPSNHER
jgi:hypothetical protein